MLTAAGPETESGTRTGARRPASPPASCGAWIAVALILASSPALAAAPARSAPPSDTLARIGPRAVTALDLVRRIEWMPWAGKQSGAGLDSAKARALESLAGEQLLAQEAARL